MDIIIAVQDHATEKNTPVLSPLAKRLSTLSSCPT